MEARSRRASQVVRATIAWLLFGGALAGLLRITCLRMWQVPLDDPQLSASLAPTLWPGDWVVLWRGTAPGYGDLVMCADPAYPDDEVVARWVGEPGDLVSVTPDGALTVAGHRAPVPVSCRRRVISVPEPQSGRDASLYCEVERVGGSHHLRAVGGVEGLRPLGLELEVPEGHLAVVSDNRVFPFDTRQYGPLPLSSCRETLRFRIYSAVDTQGVNSSFTWIE